MNKNPNPVGNVYLIDTKMFGFDKFNAAYIIRGKEIALIDTGPASSAEVVRAAIKAHGFEIGDISYIFITHEHGDHTGNAGRFLKENSKTKVFASPIDIEMLTNPEKEAAWMKSIMKPQMRARFGTMEPVPASRLETLNDGDTFDLGDGEKLKIITTPGHQPSGIVIYSETTQGMFINDLVGLNLADADAHWIFTPPKSDVREAIKSLEGLINIPISWLYTGHFGIWDDAKEVMQGALNRMQWLMDIGASSIAEGKPEEIEIIIIDKLMHEAEKIRKTRGEGLYEYVRGELIPHLGQNFSRYYLELNK